jgi:protein ImuB
MKKMRPDETAQHAERAKEIQRIIGILHNWGVHTLGDLAALRRDDLAARLGPEAARMWDRATGKATRLLKLVQPPETFEEAFEFENEIETTEPLLFILRRFLQQLSLRLSAIYLVAKELRLRLVFADKNSYEHRFQIPEPTNSSEVLFRMLHTHLEDFKSEHPIVAVSLAAQPAKGSEQQFGLFETALRDPSQLYETLARLVGLLGADRVGTPVLEETHRPDAFRIEPFKWQLSDSAGKDEPLPSYALRRIRRALPASVKLAENRPQQIRARELNGAVVDRKGPYTASGNWWDKDAWSRAEWDLQLENGTLCRCHQHEHGWAVDGIYD